MGVLFGGAYGGVRGGRPVGVSKISETIGRRTRWGSDTLAKVGRECRILHGLNLTYEGGRVYVYTACIWACIYGYTRARRVRTRSGGYEYMKRARVKTPIPIPIIYPYILVYAYTHCPLTAS